MTTIQIQGIVDEHTPELVKTYIAETNERLEQGWAPRALKTHTRKYMGDSSDWKARVGGYTYSVPSGDGHHYRLFQIRFIKSMEKHLRNIDWVKGYSNLGKYDAFYPTEYLALFFEDLVNKKEKKGGLIG